MALTLQQLQKIMPHCPTNRATTFLPCLNTTMDRFGINTPQRQAAFLANVAHETMELQYTRELWGPTDQQKRYWNELASQLGNPPGDQAAAFNFRGAGTLQITGKFNFTKASHDLGVDLVANPNLAGTAQVACDIGGWFWQTHGLNELADLGLFTNIVKRINGGTNGLQERQNFYNVALKVLLPPVDTQVPNK